MCPVTLRILEIREGKLTEMFSSGPVISTGRVLFNGEGTKIYVVVIHFNPNAPLLAMTRHSFVLRRGGPGSLAAITLILGLGANAHVISLTVQTVVVFVVYLDFAVSNAKDETVKVDCLAVLPRRSVDRMLLRNRIPTQRGHPLIVLVIDESCVAFGKRNLFHPI